MTSAHLPLALFLGLLATVSTSSVRAADTDCNTRLPEHSDPSWSCVKASSFSGGCVPAAAFQSWKCLELDADATFCDDDQPFHTTVYLTTSDVNLDCQGQTIAHDADERNVSRPGIRAPYARSVSDIGIRNCNIRDMGSYGIDMHRFFRGAELNGTLVGHQRISIDNVSIAHTSRIGVYVGQSSREIAIDHVTIDDSFIGIYLEAATTHTRISYATISNSHDREAIAIDSSQHNLIEHSVFHGNAGGGIKLYKNCGEVDGQICPIRREMSASHNTLRFNELYSEDITVASRQFKWYGPDRCIGIDVSGFWRDHADHNLVVGNYLEHGKIDVQDAHNTVYGNVLESSTIELGTNAPPTDAPIDMEGVVAENEFGEESDIVLDALPARFEKLELYNNRLADGTCWDGNTCRGATLLWGDKIVSAGMIAVLF